MSSRDLLGLDRVASCYATGWLGMSCRKLPLFEVLDILFYLMLHDSKFNQVGQAPATPPNIINIGRLSLNRLSNTNSKSYSLRTCHASVSCRHSNSSKSQFGVALEVTLPSAVVVKGSAKAYARDELSVCIAYICQERMFSTQTTMQLPKESHGRKM